MPGMEKESQKVPKVTKEANLYKSHNKKEGQPVFHGRKREEGINGALKPPWKKKKKRSLKMGCGLEKKGNPLSLNTT